MSWLSNLFRPSKSIILIEDQVVDPVGFQEKIIEVKKYYQFCKVSELLEKLEKKKPGASACLIFKHPRKSVFLNAVPSLLSNNIPFSIVLDVECVGLNRLPLEEELSIFAEHYGKEVQALKQLVWSDPQRVDQTLEDWRKSVGPLPLDKLEPTLFFATWGQVLDLPPKLAEIGLHMGFAPTEGLSERHQQAVQFIENQAKRPVKFAYSPRSILAHQLRVERLGIRAVVSGDTAGPIDKNTNPLQLPVWELQ